MALDFLALTDAPRMIVGPRNAAWVRDAFRATRARRQLRLVFPA